MRNFPYLTEGGLANFTLLSNQVFVLKYFYIFELLTSVNSHLRQNPVMFDSVQNFEKLHKWGGEKSVI